MRDLARKVGTFTWPVSRLEPNDCEARWVPIAGIDLAGSFVLASPVTPWPQELVYSVNGTNSSSEFKVQVCYRHTGLSTDRDWVPGAEYSFKYAVVGP